MTDIIVKKSDQLAHLVYKLTKNFPKDELYGITSQIRRSSLSIVLNLIEGFARTRKSEYIHFIEIAYGSLKETKYLLHFCFVENYISQADYITSLKLSEEIGKLLWNKMKRLKIEQRQ